MARVTQDHQLRDRIDDYIDYLLVEWRALPSIAAEWPEWQDHEQLDFVVEWPIREDRLRQLRLWAEQDVLTPEQRSHYEEILRLVAEHRPTLERLLADKSGGTEAT